MNTTDELILIANGDSWTYGCEIVDPILLEKYPNINHLTEIDYLPENDNYRLPRIWSTKLAELLKCKVMNISEPGDDNNSILSRTQEYVLHLLSQGVKPEQLFIVIGWTSPERRDFWYKSDDNTQSYKFKLNPHTPKYNERPLTELTKTYALNFWNPEEYIVRYVTTVLNFQNFCLAHGIKFLSFNAFYRQKNADIGTWKDINIEEQLDSLSLGSTPISDNSTRKVHRINYNTVWQNIDSIRYYNKDNVNNSFKTFVDNTLGPQGYTGWHPNEDGHSLWTTELFRYIQEHKLLNIGYDYERT